MRMMKWKRRKRRKRKETGFGTCNKSLANEMEQGDVSTSLSRNNGTGPSWILQGGWMSDL
jgi:hypothetical protein